jgi:hypothetical protein
MDCYHNICNAVNKLWSYKVALSATACAAAVSMECASIAVPVPKIEKFQQVLF